MYQTSRHNLQDRMTVFEGQYTKAFVFSPIISMALFTLRKLTRVHPGVSEPRLNLGSVYIRKRAKWVELRLLCHSMHSQFI